MDEVKELVDEAWKLLRSTLDRSDRALRANADAATVTRVVTTALRRVEDIEAYALLAAAADAQATVRIRELIAELEELRDSLPGIQEG